MKSKLTHGLIFHEEEFEKLTNLIQAYKEKKTRERANVEFGEARTVNVLPSNKFENEFGKKKESMTNGVLRVFWYDKNEVLTNQPAGYVKRPRKTFVLNPKDEEREKMKKSSPFLLWYDTQTKALYWDWSPIEKREGTKWFESKETKDLKEFCFGKSIDVFAKWTNHFKRTKFTVEYATNNLASPTITNFTLSGDMKLNIDLLKPDFKKLDEAIAKATNDQAKAKQDLKQFDEDFKQWENLANDVLRIAKRPSQLKNEIDTKEEAQKKAKGIRAKKEIGKEIKDLKKAWDDSRSLQKDPKQNKQKDLRDFTLEKFKIQMLAGDICESIKECKEKLTGKRGELTKNEKDAKGSIDAAKKAKDDAEKNWRDKIRDSMFRMRKVEGVPR